MLEKFDLGENSREPLLFARLTSSVREEWLARLVLLAVQVTHLEEGLLAPPVCLVGGSR